MTVINIVKEGSPDIITKRVALVLHLLDDYTGGEAIGRVDISAGPESPGFIIKPGGYYVFCGLTSNKYTFRIQSDYYFPAAVDVDVIKPLEIKSQSQLIQTIKLIPCPSYPFYKGTTLIRGTVKDKNSGQLVPNAQLKMHIISPLAGLYTMEADYAQADEKLLKIRHLDVKSPLIINENVLQIVNEEILVKNVGDLISGMQELELYEGLNITYSPGTKVEFVSSWRLNTFTTEKGEFVLYFKNYSVDRLKNIHFKLDMNGTAVNIGSNSGQNCIDEQINISAIVEL